MVRWGVFEGVRLEAEGAADAARAAVAGGEDVDVGVADHDGFCRSDGTPGDVTGFRYEPLKTVRVGLLGVEAVAAVVLEEKAGEIEVGADVAGWVDGFIREDRHEDSGVSGSDGIERFEDTGVKVGVVELVDAVVVEKECKCFGYIFFVVEVALGVAKGAADEDGGTVSDVAGDDGFGEFRFAEVREGGIDGVAKVDA